MSIPFVSLAKYFCGLLTEKSLHNASKKVKSFLDFSLIFGKIIITPSKIDAGCQKTSTDAEC